MRELDGYEIKARLNRGKGVISYRGIVEGDTFKTVQWIEIEKDKNGYTLFKNEVFESFDGVNMMDDLENGIPVNEDIVVVLIESNSLEDVFDFVEVEYGSNLKWVGTEYLQDEADAG